MRRCKTCREEKCETEYYKATRHGCLQSECKDCMKAREKRNRMRRLAA